MEKMCKKVMIVKSPLQEKKQMGGGSTWMDACENSLSECQCMFKEGEQFTREKKHDDKATGPEKQAGTYTLLASPSCILTSACNPTCMWLAFDACLGTKSIRGLHIRERHAPARPTY